MITQTGPFERVHVGSTAHDQCQAPIRGGGAGYLPNDFNRFKPTCISYMNVLECCLVILRALACCRVVASVLLMLFPVPSASAAQVASATLTGTVTDPSGAALGAVPVVVTRLDTNGRTEVTSTTDGVFTAAGLAPGSYEVTVAASGFAEYRRTGLRLTTGDTVRLDVRLDVASQREDVSVLAEVPALRVERASLGTLVDRERVERLPLNGRTFVTLATLVPGVTLPPGSLLPRINGGRPRVNEYLFDGISVLQPEPGQVAYFPVVDSIEEFRVESNSPPAEFGRFNGGVINLSTRSGTNRFHGTAFEFFRHDALNARNYFQSANPVKPQYRRDQFGGTFGGPLRRDRTFFFADVQRQVQGIERTVISTVPTLLQRQGIFTEAIGGRVPVIYDPATGGDAGRAPFPGNSIPAARMDPVALALLQRYPLPTSEGTSNNYRRTDTEDNGQRQWTVRLDQRWASNRDQAFGRLASFRDHVVPVTPLSDGSGAGSGTLGPQVSKSWAFAAGYQRTISGTLFNEVRVGETRRAVDRRAAQLGGTASSVLGLPGIPSLARFPNTLPTFSIAGYQQLGSPANTATDFSTGVFQVTDALTWVRGRHTFKAGLDWRWARLDVVQPPSPTGAFTFTSLFTDRPGTANTGTPLASFLLGQVQSFSIDLQRDPIQERAHIQEYFVQDDWKVTDRLTINPGLRYTLNFPSTEINGQTAVFNLTSAQLEYPGTKPVRQLHYDNLGPRFGVVYRASDRTVVSTGYGLVWIEMTGITTPFTTPTFPFLQTVSQRTLDNLIPAFVLREGPSVAPIEPTPLAGLGQGVFAVDRNLGSGYVQQWNASLQRSLTGDTTIEAAYVGSKITRVGIPDTNLNQLPAELLSLGSALTERVPNPYFGTIPRSSSLGEPTIARAQLLRPYPQYTTVSLYRNNVGTTLFQGLTLGVRRRQARGLTYSVAYTLSRLQDDASSVFDASVLTGPVANYPVADSFDRARERDYSTGHIPHVLTGSAVWDVPAGRGRARSFTGVRGALLNDWTVAAVVTLQSGSPVAVTQATNFNAFAGFGVQRPNLVGNPELPSSQRSAARWFDTAAFAAAAPFTLGTASRNPVRGPGYRNVDLSLMRRMSIGGGASLELRAEVFNALNTVNLGAPVAVQGAANFGTIVSAFDPRVVQLAARVLF